MKPSIQLKLGQSLTMTPQLQQAIRLLQLSTLDLALEIQQTVDSNPLLEIEDEFDQRESDPQGELEQHDPLIDAADATAAAEGVADASESSLDGDFDSDPSDPASDFLETNGTTANDEPVEHTADELHADSEWEETIPSELAVDCEWDDTLVSPPTSLATPATNDEMDFDSRNTAIESLGDHLVQQLHLARMSTVDFAIGLAIVDSIGTDGYLSEPIEEIHAGLSLGLGTEDEVGIDEVLAVLHRIQNFDPPGVGAQSIQECLLIQLRQLPSDVTGRADALAIVDQHLDVLASQNQAQLLKKSGLSEAELADAVALIRTLNPRPGSTVDSEQADYVQPDVTVTKEAGRWIVRLNEDSAPKVRVNAEYAGLIPATKAAGRTEDREYLRDKLQEARWFIKSLRSRNETLLKVATKIVEFQRAFFEYGPEAMRPLVLHDIADAVEMHESTISRVTSNKYMHTPLGIFELKYFFSSHVGTTTGGEVSSTAIRALIRKLCAEENPQKPFSDNKLAQLLKDHDIKVARRTVAKYRESMSIPPSNERKRLV